MWFALIEKSSADFIGLPLGNKRWDAPTRFQHRGPEVAGKTKSTLGYCNQGCFVSGMMLKSSFINRYIIHPHHGLAK